MAKKGGPDPPEAPPGPGAPPGSLGHRDSRRRQIILTIPSVESLVSLIRSFLRLFCWKKPFSVLSVPPYGGVSCARPRMGKNPIFRGPCDRLSHGAQNREIFPISVECQKHHREKDPFVLLHSRKKMVAELEEAKFQDIALLLSYRTIVSDGNLCGLETREGPWARDPPEAPPRGGGITSTTLTLFGPPFFLISSRFSRGKSGYRKKGGFFRH